MKPKINFNNKGFTFLEVIMTLFIIGVILALYQAALTCVFLSRDSGYQERALRIANNKLEEIRNAGYDVLPASGIFTDSQLASLPNSSASLTVSDYSSDLKQVSVTVQWRGPGNLTARSMNLTTLMTKVGGL